MSTKKFNLIVLASFCLTLITLVMPVVSSAQGRYANKYSKRDVSNIINKLEQSSNTFRQDFDRYMDSSSYNGTNEEDRLNDIVRNYERSLNKLRRDFDRSDNWWQSRNNVEDVMDEARQLNSMMNNLNFARKLERQWNQMRRDINKLADTYDLQDLSGGGNWGGGNNNGGGNVPSWAIGRFYGRNPQTGGTITLDINRNGNVVVTFDNGSTNYATMNGDRLNNNGAIARVTRINNGIRTTSIDSNQSIDYYNDNNGGNWGGGNNNGGGGNVPSWAIGRFYGRNPQTGGTITLDINRNGNVVVTFENGTTNYATMNGDRLNNNGAIARVTRINNGIRTTDTNTGGSIDYYINGNSGGNNNGGGGNVPSWAIGRFYGRNPQTGGRITLDINANGNVVVTFENGTTNYATLNGDRLTNNGAIARVTKINNGIRTTSIDSGESIDYRR